MTLDDNAILRSILEASNDLIAALDQQFRFVAFNTAYQREMERLFGTTVQVGQYLGDVLQQVPADRAHAIELWRRALSGEEFTVTLQMGDAARARKLYEVRYRSLRDEAGGIIGAFHTACDVSDRAALADARAELALREKEAHLSIAQTTANIGTWSWKGDMSEGSCSKEWYRIYGREPRETNLSFPEWLQWVHPEDRERVAREAEGSSHSHVTYISEYRALLPTGEVRWIASRGRAIEDASGKPVQVLGISQDVTERKHIEQVLQRSEEQYRRIVETAAEGVWVINSQAKTTFANYRMAEMLGVPHADLLNSLAFDYVFAKDLDHYREQFHAFDSQAKVFEIRLRGRDGGELWVSVSVSPMVEQGSIIAILGMFTDVTERRRAEAALRRREAMFRQMADTMPQLVWMTLPDGFHDYYNKRWYEYTGVGYGETNGGGWNELLHQEDRERAFKRWKHSIDTGESYEIEYRFRRASDGQYRWFLGRAEPIYDDAGRIVRWFGTCTDIHDSKEVEGALRRANSDLEQFAFAASHDLQEPLRIVTTYTQLLDRRTQGLLPPEALMFMRNIVDSGGRMQLLLQDLLAYTQAARSSDERLTTVDLNAAVSEAMSHLASAIEENSAIISVDPLPAVDGHRVHFVQLFQNLLSNAIKYRSAETPRVQISAAQSGVNWLISVRDNGLGIAPAYQQRIFGIFKRLHGREIPGTGIGLAICSKVIERYGGRLWVESEPEKGSTFYFTLPRG